MAGIIGNAMKTEIMNVRNIDDDVKGLLRLTKLRKDENVILKQFPNLF